ncbi:hypothetical protein UFOVP1454_4 [uncultured Caudovirales phage]|uniref:Uncharacterized protein n=1 Tax=uncultured Caudovirales phage TaxID=2100421 RepID=A0A6J5SHK0_9CAUD|nr:hypothetical protein UFOVP1454_4 [uncultured Caudovirales phage]
MICYVSANEVAIIALEAKISSNCRLPNDKGTVCWSSPPTKINNQDKWFIIKPDVDGWGEYTQEQMLAGVDLTNIIETEIDPLWLPAIENI